MDPRKIIRGKRVLIVDDEEDVLEFLSELLKECKLDRANSFENAKALLEQNPYHVAVLDIMGVRGYDLLEIARIDRKRMSVFIRPPEVISFPKMNERGLHFYFERLRL